MVIAAVAWAMAAAEATGRGDGLRRRLTTVHERLSVTLARRGEAGESGRGRQGDRHRTLTPALRGHRSLRDW